MLSFPLVLVLTGTFQYVYYSQSARRPRGEFYVELVNFP